MKSGLTWRVWPLIDPGVQDRVRHAVERAAHEAVAGRVGGVWDLAPGVVDEHLAEAHVRQHGQRRAEGAGEVRATVDGPGEGRPHDRGVRLLGHDEGERKCRGEAEFGDGPLRHYMTYVT
jgi:hypothetical protein